VTPEAWTCPAGKGWSVDLGADGEDLVATDSCPIAASSQPTEIIDSRTNILNATYLLLVATTVNCFV
jgi:hypothetical protein